MNINSPEFANFLDKIIEEKAQKIVNSILQRFGLMNGWFATVVSVNSDTTINVKQVGDSTTIPNLKNKSGILLSVGDEVELHSISSLTNAYIDICKTKDISKKQTGSSSVTIATAGTSVAVTVTFSVPFNTIPTVTCGITTLTGDAGYNNVRASTISTTAVTFTGNSYLAQTIVFNWEATGT